DTLEALWNLGLRSVQAARADASRGRQVGELVWLLSLGLDPALGDFNNRGGRAVITEASPATVANAARDILDIVASENPQACGDTGAIESTALFVPGPPQNV